jgi:hypothetical protein
MMLDILRGFNRTFSGSRKRGTRTTKELPNGWYKGTGVRRIGRFSPDGSSL